MSLTKEQLLQPRYLCTGTPGKPLWFDTELIGGEILYQETGGYHKGLYFFDGKTYDEEDLKSVPHLFKPLPWWYLRTVDDMPEYVWFKNKAVCKVDVWDLYYQDAMIFNGDLISTVSIGLLTPSTSEEYDEFLKQKGG